MVAVVELLFFGRAFEGERRTPELTDDIIGMNRVIRDKLRGAVGELEPDALIVENALTIPMNLPLGVALVAEGLVERMDPEDLEQLKGVEHDEHGHIRFATVDLGRLLEAELKRRLDERKIRRTVVAKNLGYELRCAAPIRRRCWPTAVVGHGWRHACAGRRRSGSW